MWHDNKYSSAPHCTLRLDQKKCQLKIISVFTFNHIVNIINKTFPHYFPPSCNPGSDHQMTMLKVNLLGKYPFIQKSGNSSKSQSGSPLKALYAKYVWQEPGMNMRDPSNSEAKTSHCASQGQYARSLSESLQSEEHFQV